MDTDRGGGAVGLVTLNALDVDNELLTVGLDDLADGVALVVAADNLRTLECELEYMCWDRCCLQAHGTAVYALHALFALCDHSPGPHRPCGWAYCARCTSDAAPWTGARTSAFGGCATAR